MTRLIYVAMLAAGPQRTCTGAGKDYSFYSNTPEVLLTQEQFEQREVLTDLARTAAGRNLNMDLLVQGTKALQVGPPSDPGFPLQCNGARAEDHGCPFI